VIASRAVPGTFVRWAIDSHYGRIWQIVTRIGRTTTIRYAFGPPPPIKRVQGVFVDGLTEVSPLELLAFAASEDSL